MPKVALITKTGELHLGMFQAPPKVGDLKAWHRAAIKALGFGPPFTREAQITQDKIVFQHGESVMTIDRKFPYRLSGEFGRK